MDIHSIIFTAMPCKVLVTNLERFDNGVLGAFTKVLAAIRGLFIILRILIKTVLITIIRISTKSKEIKFVIVSCTVSLLSKLFITRYVLYLRRRLFRR
jgi:hypothetical protein